MGPHLQHPCVADPAVAVDTVSSMNTVEISEATRAWLTRALVFVIAPDWPDEDQERIVAWVMTGQWPEPTPQDVP